MLTKALPLDAQVDKARREVTAYANAFAKRDEVGDLTPPGAFRKTIGESGPASRNLIKYFRGHQTMIGRPIVMEEDSTGLLTVSLVAKTAAGDEVLELIDIKALTHYSIGYAAVRSHDEVINGEDTRILDEIKLFEYGPVDFPANQDAAILGIKARDLGVSSLSDLPDALEFFGRRGFLTTEEKSFASRLMDRWPAIEVNLKALLAPKEATQPATAAPAPVTPGQPDDAAALAGLLLAVRERRSLLNLTT